MRDWLVGIFGEAYAAAAFWTIVLVAVAILLWVVLRLSRRLTPGTFVSGGRGRQPRLGVTDATPVDNHRRLVLVRRDDVEHLLLIGGPSDVVVESNITAVGAAEQRGRPERQEPVAVAPPAPVPPAPPSPPAPIARPAAPAPVRQPEPPQSRPTPPIEPRLPPEPRIQIAEAPSAQAPAERAPIPAHEPPATVQPPAPSVSPRAAPTPSPAVTIATAATGFAASQGLAGTAQHEPTGEFEDETFDELSEALDYQVSTEREEADHSLEDEMSKLLEELSDERK